MTEKFIHEAPVMDSKNEQQNLTSAERARQQVAQLLNQLAEIKQNLIPMTAADTDQPAVLEQLKQNQGVFERSKELTNNFEEEIKPLYRFAYSRNSELVTLVDRLHQDIMKMWTVDIEYQSKVDKLTTAVLPQKNVTSADEAGWGEKVYPADPQRAIREYHWSTTPQENKKVNLSQLTDEAISNLMNDLRQFEKLMANEWDNYAQFSHSQPATANN